MIRILLAALFFPIAAAANDLSQTAFVEFQSRCLDPLSEGQPQDLEGLNRLDRTQELRIISILRADINTELFEIADSSVLIAKSPIPELCQMIGFGHEVAQVARTYNAWHAASDFTAAADFPETPNPSKPAGVYLARQMEEGDFMQISVSISMKQGGFLAMTTSRVPDSESARKILKAKE